MVLGFKSKFWICAAIAATPFIETADTIASRSLIASANVCGLWRDHKVMA
jgi:hypothetical protein